MNYLFQRLEKIQECFRAAKDIFLFLDYDGTLTNIVSHPGKAWLSEEVKATLSSLTRDPRISLAIMTGRSLNDIRNKVGLEDIYYVGNHGLEIFEPSSGIKQLFPEDAIEGLRSIRDRLNFHFKDIEGIFVEDKGCAFAVHYRNVDTLWISSIQRVLEQEIRKSITPLCLHFGKKVFEIRPRTMINKGTAVSGMLGESETNGVLPVYIGDDQTDEDAFNVLKRQGVTIFVGVPEESTFSAEYYVRDPSEVYKFLKFIQGYLLRNE